MSQQKKAIAPIPIRMSVVYGAAIAGNVVGIIVATASAGYLAGIVTLYVFATLGGAMAGVIAAAAHQERGKSLEEIEEELDKIREMQDRELINQEHADRLRAGIVAQHEDHPFDWRIPFWTAVFAMSVVSAGTSNLVALIAALIGGATVAGGRTAIVLVQRMMNLPEPGASLPPAQQWEQLGSRHSDGPARDVDPKQLPG